MTNDPTDETPPVDATLVEFAVSIAREAGDLTLKRFKTPGLTITEKPDGSPVTQADLEAESLLRDLISSSYPDDAIVGEEADDTPGSSGRTWILDPIDGTQSFVHGVPLYATLIALADEHGPAIGVLNLPALNECVWAGRGQGCLANGQPAKVSTRRDLSGACVVTSGVDYWPSTSPLDQLVEHGAIIRTWGDAYGYALVATGRADAMVDPVVSQWDVAPMLTILPEAGGVFTDFTGNITDRGGTALASNPNLQPLLLELLSA
ncbi:MAG: inositol monophosphatase family protein [Actinomycetota bacterium]|nr:inositol monophosphatase family protein [Actinomycetota bacterium]